MEQNVECFYLVCMENGTIYGGNYPDFTQAVDAARNKCNHEFTWKWAKKVTPSLAVRDRVIENLALRDKPQE